MSAFNVLNILGSESQDNNPHRLQFKYGDTWQHEYSIGDHIKWGGNDNGLESKGLVVLNAIDELSEIEEFYYIFVEDNIIKYVELSDGRYKFDLDHENYLYLAN